MITYIVLYDGSCGFCNYWVKWILKNDSKKQFFFAALQSNYGQTFLKSQQLSLTDLDTIYLLEKENPKKFYKKSNAVIKIAQTVGGIYSLAVIFKILPIFLRDVVYNMVAQYRKKIMGESCYLPTPDERKQFIN